MKINGLTVDTQAIADGLYAIICEHGDEAIVAFGMIPKWIIDLTNVVRHDRASTATLALSLASNELTFVVTDDGQGTMSADAEAGHGLENMRERMAQLGGSCSLESAPTGGLKVIFRVPLTGEDQAL